MLDNTLVVWMGDFGRTPTVGKQGGRDHYPRAWTTALAGAGLKVGQAIGRTDKQGGSVENRPVSAIDFMATICSALDIDFNKNFYTRDGRPMRIVDKGEKVVRELF
jgi:arylsulfatase A-like enzyme